MRIHKRKKSRRLRGSHTHARGFKKKGRGSGHRGGFGMAGTGKRGDAKKTMVLTLFGNDYFGKDRTLRKGHQRIKIPAMNLREIQEKLALFVKLGKAKEKSGAYEVDLSGYKVLAEGDLNMKLILTASLASNSAIDKIKKAGGEIKLLRTPRKAPIPQVAKAAKEDKK